MFLNGNKLQNLISLTLKELPQLKLINLDRNEITKIDEKDLEIFSKTKKLNSLSLASNKIQQIDCNAFTYILNIKVLALQQNNISSISCLPKEDGRKCFKLIALINLGVYSVLKPLKKLEYLLLSGNQLEIIRDGDLNILSSLQELSLDHNKINHVLLNISLIFNYLDWR